MHALADMIRDEVRAMVCVYVCVCACVCGCTRLAPPTMDGKAEITRHMLFGGPTDHKASRSGRMRLESGHNTALVSSVSVTLAIVIVRTAVTALSV